VWAERRISGHTCDDHIALHVEHAVRLLSDHCLIVRNVLKGNHSYSYGCIISLLRIAMHTGTERMLSLLRPPWITRRSDIAGEMLFPQHSSASLLVCCAAEFANCIWYQFLALITNCALRQSGCSDVRRISHWEWIQQSKVCCNSCLFWWGENDVRCVLLRCTNC